MIHLEVFHYSKHFGFSSLHIKIPSYQKIDQDNRLWKMNKYNMYMYVYVYVYDVYVYV